MNNYQLKYSKTQKYNTRYCVKDMVGGGSGSGGGASYIETTYAELRALRDNGQLTKGAFYRITDYATEVNESFGCQSAHHNFDIIVLALSNDTLSEDARAVKHNTEETEAEDYFENINLSAWELKYSIDVDTARYPWAKPSGGGEIKVVVLAPSEQPDSIIQANVLSEDDDTFDGFPIKCEAFGMLIYLPSLQIANNVICLLQDESQDIELNILEVSTIIGNGKGVITMMQDEFGNKLPYDFKNIKWARYLVTDAESPFYDMYYDLQGDGEPQYFYTFDGFYFADVSCDTSLPTNNAEGSVASNVFGDFCTNNVFFVTVCHYNKFESNCYNNTFGDECELNKVGEGFAQNMSGNIFKFNKVGIYCMNNIFGNEFYSNDCGDNFESNNFGVSTNSNTFGRNFHHNTFGNACQYNKFGMKNHTIKFGDGNSYNIFEDGLNTIDKSDEVRVDKNTRRWYIDSNNDLQSEVMCYRPL